MAHDNGIRSRRAQQLKQNVNRPHYVYQFWASDHALYVGMTSNPAGRIATHAGTPWWRWVCHFEAEVFPDRDSARAAEEELIVRLQPTYNFQHTDLAAGSRAGGRVNWRKTDVIGDAS